MKIRKFLLVIETHGQHRVSECETLEEARDTARNFVREFKNTYPDYSPVVNIYYVAFEEAHVFE